MTLFSTTGTRLVWRLNRQTLWVEAWGLDSIRVRATQLTEMPEPEGCLLPAGVSVPKIEISGDHAILTNGALTATVDAKGRVRFFKTGSLRSHVV